MNIQNKHQWEKVFMQACKSGHLEDLRHLCQKQYLDKGWANLHAWDEHGFCWACKNGQLEVVKYLLTSKELIEAGHTWANLHVINELGFRWACEHGQLDVVKYLLTSKELIEAGHTFANLHASDKTGDDAGFRLACENGQLEVVKYLLTSKELKEAGHTWANLRVINELGFRWACENKHEKLVRWLVFDYGIERNMDIENIIQAYPQTQDYFRAREELQSLYQSIHHNPPEKSSVIKEGIQKLVHAIGNRLLFKKEIKPPNKNNESCQNEDIAVKPKARRL